MGWNLSTFAEITVGLIFFGTFVIGLPPIKNPQCSSEKCPWKLWSHYAEKGCEPMYEDNQCCPTRFQCPDSAFNQDTKGCRFNGKLFPFGSSIASSDKCRKCRCRSGSVSSPARIECMHSECPEHLLPPDPTCILLYKQNDCCSDNTYCPADDFGSLTKPEPVCTYGNKTFLEGERIDIVEDSCTVCVCQKGFNGPDGPGCRKIDYCYLDNQDNLSNGCIPVYHPDVCCPIDWICPEAPSFWSAPSSSGGGKKCSFDGSAYPVGSKLPLQKECVTCKCTTPPEFTCTQPRHC